MLKQLILFFFCASAIVAQSLNFSNGQVFNGQQAVTATATALANQPLRTICVKALHGNAAAIYIGNSSVTTANCFEMIADQGYCANVTNANVLFVVSGGSGNVSWIGTN